MIRIWAKIIKEDKIVNQTVYENYAKLDYAEFYNYVRDICESLDCTTPVVLKTHIFSYAKYNTVRFYPDDFVGGVDFDKLVLENALI